MHWKAVAVALCSVPVLAGCGAVRNLTNETRLAHAQRAIEHDLRSEARAAWQTVRAQNDRRAFTEEFYDGFLDGYVDYLDRGGAAQPPAAPPMKYVREKRYYSEQGHCLINDYYLGFKYGAEVAVASGRRRFLTVPVALADPNCDPAALPPGPPAVPTVPKKPKSDDPLPPPRPLPAPGNKFTDPNTGDEPPRGTPIPPLPKPELPVIKPFNPDLGGDDKFAPPAPDRNPDLLPPPYPALPVPVPPDPRPLPLPEPIGPLPPMLGPLPLPAPPTSVPLLPSGAVVPVTDPVPVVPFRHPAPTGGFTVPWKK